jgi:hypothetical protein
MSWSSCMASMPRKKPSILISLTTKFFYNKRITLLIEWTLESVKIMPST